jgi:hypothetical protein
MIGSARYYDRRSITASMVDFEMDSENKLRAIVMLPEYEEIGP